MDVPSTELRTQNLLRAPWPAASRDVRCGKRAAKIRMTSKEGGNAEGLSGTIPAHAQLC